jgi:hypothetical protein
MQNFKFLYSSCWAARFVQLEVTWKLLLFYFPDNPVLGKESQKSTLTLLPDVSFNCCNITESEPDGRTDVPSPY